jgi:hypothetical protein
MFFVICRLIQMHHQHPDIEPCIKKTEKLLQELDKLDSTNSKPVVDSSVLASELRTAEVDASLSTTDSSVSRDAYCDSVTESSTSNCPTSRAANECLATFLESPVSIASDLELMKDQYVECESSLS